MGTVQTASVVYMQKYIILLKLDHNNPKHSEEASDFSFCNLQILKGKKNEAVEEKANKFWTT